MLFSILGGGFGLYGYLPALIRCGHAVTLPERYRATLERRSELRGLLQSVQWRATEDAIRDIADTLVISRRPSDQSTWLRQYVNSARASAFILEKPIAASPASAFELLDLLTGARKTYRIAYTFRFMPWARDLEAATAAEKPGPIDIVWKFRAHHYQHDRHNWKRHVSEGGGAIRFFGIHLIGLLAEFGYREVSESRCTAVATDECETWFATFRGPGLRECRVLVDSNAGETAFRIDSAGDPQPLFHQPGPVSSVSRPDGLDNRVEVLESLCKSLSEETAQSLPWYAQSIALWDQTERASSWDHGSRA